MTTPNQPISSAAVRAAEKVCRRFSIGNFISGTEDVGVYLKEIEPLILAQIISDETKLSALENVAKAAEEVLRMGHVVRGHGFKELRLALEQLKEKE